MPRISFILILTVTATVALAQKAQEKASAVSAKPPANVSAAQKSTAKAVLAPTDPVIKLEGLCASAAQTKPGAKASACNTLVSRREFESFVNFLNATSRGIDRSNYRGAAEMYAGLVVSSDLASKAAVDKDPRFQQILKAARLNALGAMYRVQKVNEAENVPAGEIEAYYKKNIASFDEVTLERFMLPRNNPANLRDPKFQEKSKQLVDELRARAVKGEDIYKLEQEGLQRLGVKEKPGVVPVGVRRGQLEEKAEKAIFALGSGGVTPVLDTRGVWLFYKRTSRRILPLDIVGPEIKGKFFHEKLAALDKSLHDAVHVDYNEAYFGPPQSGLQKALQTAQAVVKNAGTAKPQENTAGKTMAPGDAVITIHGLCGGGQQNSAPGTCTVVVTRAQFETLMSVKRATGGVLVEASPRSLAEQHVDVLIYGHAAERAGMEKDPRFTDLMNVVRRRALSDLYRLTLDEQAHQASPEEMEAYYKKNLSAFDQVTLLHISVPRGKPGVAHDSDFDARAKKLAADLRERALKGDDMDKLQREAYEMLGMSNPPAALMQPIRRGALDPHAEQDVFALKSGQVTTVQAFPPAYVIYKLVRRRTVPLTEAKTEISQVLYQKKLEKLLKANGVIRAQYNEVYFASSSSGGPGTAARNAVASRAAHGLN